MTALTLAADSAFSGGAAVIEHAVPFAGLRGRGRARELTADSPISRDLEPASGPDYQASYRQGNWRW